jgi:gamma-glutamyltranspeptidase/glutathione hydrolase
MERSAIRDHQRSLHRLSRISLRGPRPTGRGQTADWWRAVARHLVRATCLSLVLAAPAAAQPILDDQPRHAPAFARHGMVASQEARATRIGVEVLRRGGNAVDAAVAVGFALAVTLPRAGNLGGGGFMLLYRAASEHAAAIDYRETAPAAAGRDLFLDAAGAVDARRARFSHLSAGVPGTVAGLALAADRYGTWPLARLVAPAIALAESGIEADRELAETLNARAERFRAWPASAAVFLKQDGTPWQAGDRLRQPDLAWSLRQIADHGPAAFYTGKLAARLAADQQAGGGVMTAADLAAYRAVERAPVEGSYRGHRVLAMPPPSSGGVHLVQMLNMLAGDDVAALGHNGAAGLHLLAEVMKRAFADRAEYLGDPDFWPVPVKGLTSPAYAARLRAGIDPDRATPAIEIKPGGPQAYESDQTTHFAVIDRFGNAVANTYTINFSYGSGIVAAGTGILWNNEMDDFAAKPGVPNAYGLVGGAANAIEGGKRPLSSMTPTLVMQDGKVWLATGSPGGPRIITTVLQVLLNLIDHRMGLGDAVAAPRIHHQWLPDVLFMEPGFSPDTVALLRQRGHRVKPTRAWGSAQTVLRGPNGYYGIADPRRAGALAEGY